MATHADRAGRLNVSLVATVLNEYGSLPGWLEGLRRQSRLPDEFIVVDGGSSDGTLEALRAAELPFPFVVCECPGANISEGRNVAIRRAVGDIIVLTDAGTRAAPDWVERLLHPFEADPTVDISAGFFEGTGISLWTRTLSAISLPSAGEIAPDTFLPSSRSLAIRRRWLCAGFEYPEWLDYCEDVVLDLQLRRAGARQRFSADALVYFEPRRGPISFFRQYYRYARGDGKAGLFAPRHAIRYATYIGAVAVLRRRRVMEMAVATLLGFAYIRPGVRRYTSGSGSHERGRCLMISAVGLMTLQRLIGDIAKMAGYPVGLWWRARRDRSLRFWKSTWVSRAASGDLPRS